MDANTPTKHDAGSRQSPPSRRGIAYVRVSTVGQAERGMGLQAQTTTITAYAREHGLVLLEVVREAASGAIKEGEALSHEHRPVLDSLLDRAKAGGFDVLLVARLDRLSRDFATLVFLERTFRRHGVTVVSATEENGDGAYAEFTRGILAGVAELERQMILKRVRDGKAEKKKLGRHVHGSSPYGYRSTGGVFEVVDEEAAIVRRIFAEARDGRSPARIARDLNDDGIPSSRGAGWSRQGIRAMLRNDAYAGVKYEVKNAHPAIVSRRLFNQVQAGLRARTRA